MLKKDIFFKLENYFVCLFLLFLHCLISHFKTDMNCAEGAQIVHESAESDAVFERWGHVTGAFLCFSEFLAVPSL